MGEGRPGSGTGDLQRRMQAAEGERDELWAWLVGLQHRAETGFRALDLVHELNNDLQQLFTTVQLAQMGDDPEELGQALEEVIGVARGMKGRLARFADAAARSGSESASTSVGELTAAALEALAYPVAKTRVRVEHHVDGLERVTGDRVLLAQALSTALFAVLRRIPTPSRTGPAPRVRLAVAGDTQGISIGVSSDDVVEDPAWMPEGEPWRKRSTGFEHRVAARIVAEQGGQYTWDEAAVRARITLPAAPDDPYRIDV